MRPQSVVVALLALVFGGAAAVGVRGYVNQRTGAPQEETVKVVVAATSIPRGMLVSPDLVKTHDYPKHLVPEGAILKADDADGRSAFTSMAKDEPLLESKLSPKGHRGMASLVPNGMRAYTITTPNVSSGVAGFILPGNKVDVLLTITSNSLILNGVDYTGGGSTTPLLQNVEILAVDQKVEAPAENKVDTKDLRSVTLLVTPQQATKLDLGQGKGQLHLMLRNPEDTATANVRPTTLREIQFAGEAPVRPWDERAKDLIKAWGEAMAKAPPKAASPQAQQPAEVKKVIRTIRGNAEGAVVVTVPRGQGA